MERDLGIVGDVLGEMFREETTLKNRGSYAQPSRTGVRGEMGVVYSGPGRLGGAWEEEVGVETGEWLSHVGPCRKWQAFQASF